MPPPVQASPNQQASYNRKGARFGVAMGLLASAFIYALFFAFSNGGSATVITGIYFLNAAIAITLFFKKFYRSAMFAAWFPIILIFAGQALFGIFMAFASRFS